MGICSSCESASVITAKLILQDGQLLEFQCSAKVSNVLQNYPSCFICNSDLMNFDDYVSPMHADEELLPGHLYFALPLTRISCPLQPEEMAALAVKASLALAKTRDANGLCFKETTQMVCGKEQGRTTSRAYGYSVGGVMGKKRNTRSTNCKGGERNFTSRSKLTAVLETE